jgi:hypothetical protein
MKFERFVDAARKSFFTFGGQIGFNCGGTVCGVWEMQTVASLRHEEAVRFDADRLEALCREHGDDAAEKVIAHALEQIAIKMASLEALFEAKAHTDMERVCSSLTIVAAQIGMTSLSRVARDVRACLKVDDMVGVHATMGRLMRIGDNSVHAIWSLEDVSL